MSHSLIRNTAAGICLAMFAMTVTCLSSKRATAQSFETNSRFIPTDAQMLISMNPAQIAGTPLVDWIVSPGLVERHFPKQMGKVDTVIISGQSSAIAELAYATAGTFQDIAETLEIGAIESSKPSKANDLNKPFTAIIRFETAIEDSAITSWLGDETFVVIQQQGFDVFDNHSEECCKVVRIDDRTIVVGGRQEIDASLASEDSHPVLEQKFTQDLLETEFNLVVDIQKYNQETGAMPPLPGLDSATLLALRIDFSGDVLGSLETKFEDEKMAHDFTDACRKYHATNIKMFEDEVVRSGAHRSREDVWLMEQAIELGKTVEFTQANGSSVAQLDRPDNFIELTMKMSEAIQKIEQQVEAEFNDIAMELDAATDAAAEAGFQALNDAVELEDALNIETEGK